MKYQQFWLKTHALSGAMFIHFQNKQTVDSHYLEDSKLF